MVAARVVKIQLPNKVGTQIDNLIPLRDGHRAQGRACDMARPRLLLGNLLVRLVVAPPVPPSGHPNVWSLAPLVGRPWLQAQIPVACITIFNSTTKKAGVQIRSKMSIPGPSVQY